MKWHYLLGPIPPLHFPQQIPQFASFGLGSDFVFEILSQSPKIFFHERKLTQKLLESTAEQLKITCKSLQK